MIDNDTLKAMQGGKIIGKAPAQMSVTIPQPDGSNLLLVWGATAVISDSALATMKTMIKLAVHEVLDERAAQAAAVAAATDEQGNVDGSKLPPVTGELHIHLDNAKM